MSYMYYHAVADELAGRPTILVVCNGLSLLLSLSLTHYSFHFSTTSITSCVPLTPPQVAYSVD